MEDDYIVTIGRQYGSGGRVIGKELAQRLGFDYFDKELINEAAKHSGLAKGCFEEKDEKEMFSIPAIFSANWLSMGSGAGMEGALTNEHIFKYQSDVIEMLSHKGKCVIVGRCADYILRHYPHCVNIFIHAPMNERVKRVMARDHIGEKDAFALAQRRDKQRASYYNFYTDKQWGDSSSYHLSIDSSILGIQDTTELIYQFIMKYKSSLLL